MKFSTKLAVTLIITICVSAILGAGLFIGNYCFSYYQGNCIYEDIQGLAISNPTDDVKDPIHVEPPALDSVIDFDALKAINPDIEGWIYIPDTRINYPIVKRLNDNDYYLSHLFDGTVNKSGSIFLDTRCSFGDKHILIHGHNMGNGSMFRDLELFKNKEFFLSHPYYLIFTPEETYVVEVIAGSVNRIDSPIWQLDFQDSDDYEKWIATCKEKANVSCSFNGSSLNKVISLSTCSYEYTQARWLLQGIPHKTEDIPTDVYRELLLSFLSE